MTKVLFFSGILVSIMASLVGILTGKSLTHVLLIGVAFMVAAIGYKVIEGE